MPVSEGHRMRDKQKTKDQLINELAKLRQQISKSEKSETRHNQAEQALRESEQNYRQLTDSISDVFFEMDKDLRYTYWNKASEKLTGISAKDAIGKSLSELFPDTLNTRKAERVYLDVLRTQQPQTFINEYIFGGKDFFFDISAYPSKRGLSVFVKDITDRKQAEEELREKEEFNFALFQHNPIQTMVVDRGGRVLKVNMAKRKSGDRLPKIGDVMYKDYAAKHEIDMHAELMECIRSSKTKRFSELKYGDKFLTILIAPFPHGAIITSLDITERKRAEEALHASEGRYRSLFDNMLEGFAYCKIIVDKNNKPIDFEYTKVNDAFEALTGLKKEYIIGKRATEAIPSVKKAHPVLFKIYGKVALTGKPANFDIYFEPLKIWLSISVYCPKRGYFVAIFDNITERKLAEEEIRASLKEKEVLLQEVHHRVKNNMQLISSLFSLQSRRIKDKQAFEILKSSQNRIRSMGLIHEKLYKTKDFARVDFNEYVRSLTNHLFSSYGINKEAIKLNTNIKDVFLDINTAIPCGLIINELVSNSMKYGFPDGKKGEIKIAVLPLNKNKVELIVSDNGVGLPEEVEFRNTESLGLHLVTILVDGQLHGDIKLERDGGTSFHIRFKVKK
jgi:PAS domain S-box-containing protein